MQVESQISDIDNNIFTDFGGVMIPDRYFGMLGCDSEALLQAVRVSATKKSQRIRNL